MLIIRGRVVPTGLCDLGMARRLIVDNDAGRVDGGLYLVVLASPHERLNV